MLEATEQRLDNLFVVGGTMDVNKIIKDKEFFRKRLLDKKLQLENVVMANREYEQLEQEKIAGEAIEQELKQYLADLVQLKDNVNFEDKEYRNRRIDFLNSELTEMLYKFFPNKGLIADIIFDDKYKGSNAYLQLKDADNNIRTPENTEGGLGQYLISYAAVTGVLKALNQNIVFLDEAFGVSDKTNLVKIGELLHKSCEEGMQIILATQDPLLYSSVPHRAFCLELDVEKDSVVIDKVLDVD